MNFEDARQNMVDSQLRPNKITNTQLLGRFLRVPRETFVDHPYQAMAYADEPIAIGYNRKMLAPMVCARLLQEMQLNADDQALVVAAGTGYSAFIMAPLVAHVTVLEENPYLSDIARKNLLDLELSNVTLVTGKPEVGQPHGTFDKILIDAPAAEVPASLFDQLKNGGKLGVVTRNDTGLLEATVYSKTGKTMFEAPLMETKGDILPNFAQKERFVF